MANRINLFRPSPTRRRARRAGGRLAVVGAVVGIIGLVLAPSAMADSGLSLVKTANPVEGGTVDAGGTITYTIAVSNAPGALDAATGVTVTDATPANTTYVADSATISDGVTNVSGPSNPFEAGLAIADIPPGGTTTMSFSVTVASPLADGTQITNTATATATNDPNPAPTDTAIHTVVSSPVLTVGKTADPAEGGQVGPGATITYTIVVANDASASTTATGVTLADPTPANTAYVADSAIVNGQPAPGPNPFAGAGMSLADLAPGASHTASFQVRVDSPLPNGTAISNTATASASNHADVSDGAGHTVSSAPTLSVLKSAAPAKGGTVVPGDEITYTVLVGNAETATEAATTVTILDPTPADTKYVAESATVNGTPVAGAENPFAAAYALPNLPPGASHTITYKVTVDTPLANDTTITNTATADSQETQPVSDTATHTVASSPTLTISKTADPAESSLVQPGNTITYTITVQNAAEANDAGRGLVLTDATPENTTFLAGSVSLNGTPVEGAENPLAAGMSLPDLAPGASHSIVYQATVNTPLASGIVVSNVATLKADNASEISDAADHTIDSEAVISPVVTAKPADGTEVAPGKSITYTITFTNDETSTAPLTGVTFTDPTPEGTIYEAGSAHVNGQPLDGSGDGDGGGTEPGDPTPSPPLTMAAATNPFSAGAPLDDLMPGESHTVRFKVEVKPSATGSIINTATIGSANQPEVVITTTHTVAGDDGSGGDTGGDTGGSESGGDTSGGGSTTVGGDTSGGGSTSVVPVGGSASGGGSLANTGFGASPLLIMGVLLLLAGATLHLIGRDPYRAKYAVAVAAGPARHDSTGSFFF